MHAISGLAVILSRSLRCSEGKYKVTQGRWVHAQHAGKTMFEAHLSWLQCKLELCQRKTRDMYAVNNSTYGYFVLCRCSLGQELNLPTSDMYISNVLDEPINIAIMVHHRNIKSMKSVDVWSALSLLCTNAFTHLLPMIVSTFTFLLDQL